jgi:predicted AAA+ superfamily ATPase
LTGYSISKRLERTRSAKGNYALWLYYHQLNKDIFFKALINCVEPKIRLEENRLKSLRGRKEAAGSSGREAKQIERTWIGKISWFRNCMTLRISYAGLLTYIWSRT